jgi:hypothetical protein
METIWLQRSIRVVVIVVHDENCVQGPVEAPGIVSEDNLLMRWQAASKEGARSAPAEPELIVNMTSRRDRGDS